MNGRQPSITLGNKEMKKIGFLNRDKTARKSSENILQ